MQTIIEPQFKDLGQNFIASIKSFEPQVRETVRRFGSRWVELVRSEVPQREGNLSAGISYVPFSEGEDAVGFAGISPQPLGNFVKFGTKPHKISARNTDALRFYWRKTGLFTIVPRSGGFKTYRVGRTLYVGKGYVDHPGTKPNQYHLRAYDKFWPEVKEEVRRISKRFVVSVVRGITGRPA